MGFERWREKESKARPRRRRRRRREDPCLGLVVKREEGAADN